MSSLLEQAIIDATALREAAVKNAESAILDKYSTDIREAVESLLEQDDEEMDMAGGEEPTMIGSENLEDSIPLGASSDDALEEQEIVIDFKDLKAMAEQLTDAEESAEGGDPMGDKLPHPTGVGSDEVATASMEVSLEEEIEFMGPVKVKDVEAAQSRVIAATRSLEESGEIMLGGHSAQDDIIQ